MKLRNPPRVRDNESGIIPLINVVFLLLIFFMITGRISPPDAIEIDPPASQHAAAFEQQAPTLLIDNQGRLVLDGEALATADLETTLARAAEQWQADLTVLKVKADAGLEADRLIELLGRLRNAGVEELLLLTTAGQP